MLGQRGQRPRELLDAPAAVAADRSLGEAVDGRSGTGPRVFVHVCADHDTTGSNHPPDVADPPRPLEPGERHRRLGDRQRQRRRRRRRACADRRGTPPARRPRRPAAADAGRTATDPARRVSSPSATSTSSASVTGAAPSRSSWLVPAAARLRTEPGTAITSTDRSIAAWAVISEPPRSRLSTTTSTSLSAARMRLRSGNRNGSGGVPGGHSDSSTPRSHTSAHSRAWTFGYGAVGPVADDGDRAARPARAERAAVGGAVDALGQPGHDGDAGGGEVAAELERGVAAGLGGVARADDADPPAVEHGEVAADEQHRRRLGVVAQLHRVASDRRSRGPTTPTLRHARAHTSGGRALGRRPPRRGDRGVRAASRRPPAPARAAPGGDGERLVRVVVGEQRAAAARSSSGRSRRARRARRCVAAGHHATTPDRRRRAGAVRSDSATSTGSTSSCVGDVPGARRRAGRRSCGPRAGSGGSRDR